jgi:hypothetical protein
MNYPKNIKNCNGIDELSWKPKLPLSINDVLEYIDCLDDELSCIKIPWSNENYPESETEDVNLVVFITKKEVLGALGFDVSNDYIEFSNMKFEGTEYVDDVKEVVEICDYDLSVEEIEEYLINQKIITL